MKATNRHDLVKAIAFMVFVFFFISCNPQDEPVPPVIKKTMAVVKIGIAENVKLSTAKINAIVIPNEDNTKISFEYQTVNSAWVSSTLPTLFSGKDSVKVTLDLSDLQLNTVYNFRIRASNLAGDTASTVSSFRTYAVVDYDGNYYHTVTIGTQTWLQENLKSIHFANGDAIANVKDMTAWGNLTTGAYCEYNNDDKIAKVYGNIYNFFVSSDSRPLIVGYHVPVAQEWNTLAKNFSDRSLTGPALMEAGTAHWISPFMPATNSTGFTALPNGGVSVDKDTKIGEFNSLGTCAGFLSADEFSGFGSATIIDQKAQRLVFEGLYLKTDGMGIRLVKN